MQQNLGGLSDQGVDDNASGLGVMMELAARLASTPLHYSLLFVALSGEDIGQQGSEDCLSRMTQEDKYNTLLVKASDGVKGKAPRAVAAKFAILLRHQTQKDNLTCIDRWLPGRITSLTHDSVTVLQPLIRELANP